MNAIRSFSDEKFGAQWSNLEKDWLRDLFRDGVVIVEFVKKDGTLRKIVGTLQEQKIPSEKAPKNVGREKNDDVLAIFDLEKSEWRSFRYDSVRKINFNL